MNFADYYPLALRTAKTLPTLRDELRHCLLGLVTEMGEFISEVKRVVIYDKPISDDMSKHMREEVGDFSWYIPVGMRAMGGFIELPAPEKSLVRYFNNLGDLVIPGTLLVGCIAALIIELDDGNEPDRDFVALMLAGLVYFVDATALLLGTTGDQLRSDNIVKLQLRFPGAFTNEAAEARADKSGVDHRNS